MAFFDKISDLGKQAAQKTGEAVEAGKLTLKVKEKEKEIVKVRAEIGKTVYETAQDGAEYNDTIKSLIAKIAALEVEIDELNAVRASLSDNTDEQKQDSIVDEAVSESMDE